MAETGEDEFVPEYHFTPGESSSRVEASRGRQAHSSRIAASSHALSPIISDCSPGVVTSPGSPTTLQCHIEADPSPSVQWFHNGEECADAKKFCTLRVGSCWCLLVMDFSADDAGDYRVLASNLHGSQDFTFHVAVLNPLPPREDTSRGGIPVKEFPSLVARMQNSALMDEFFSIEVPMDVSQHAGNLTCNQYKNRYYNVLPYDHSRVVLPIQDGTPGSDYINACHMTEDYIASQGPLPNTFEDFWRMVWKFNIHVIAMVTKLSDEHSFHMKCHRYWPKKESLPCGDFSISLKEMKSFQFCEVRTLEVTKLSPGDEDFPATRTICHFQFLSWPEYGVPEKPSDLVDFRNKVSEYRSTTDGPLLVHCSAGVGRTGTYMCIDMLLKRIEKDGGSSSIDVFNLVRQLRFRRERTVETPEQYMLIHKALAEVITSQHMN